MKAWLMIAGIFMAGWAPAQDLPATTQQQLENLGDENLEDDALLQQLSYYRRHPVNLNTATITDLQALRFLTDLQIANFLRHRRLAGLLIDIHELQAVPGFDIVTIQKILPYVFAGPNTDLKETLLTRLKGGEAYILGRFSRQLQKPKGYDTSLTTYYTGDPNRLQLRYRYQYKNLLYYGLLADKDAGEPAFSAPARAGFEFYSAHFFIRNLGKIKALAIGDYTVNLGQGLTQWQALAFGKSAEAMTIKRQLPVLLPYRSAGEFYFNRGLGITIAVKNWEATAFLSRKRFSGNLAFDSVDHFTSFQTGGYYRTRGEIADRNAIGDLSAGGNLCYRSNNLQVGWNLVYHRFSLPLKKPGEPYNYFAPRGEQLLNQSIDYSYTYRNVHLFGEVAIDRLQNRAFVQGALVSLDKRVDLAVLYRSISPGYQAPFGNAFTEGSLPSNEKGIYAGLVVRPAGGWQLSAYADVYQSPFIKYRVAAPSRGKDYLLQLSYAPGKQHEIYLRLRSETKAINPSGVDSVLQFPADQSKTNLRLHLTTRVHPLVTVKARVEMMWLKQATGVEEGFLSFVEVSTQAKGKWRANMRCQYFETGSYNSRIYAYETDVLYYFSIPAFFDKGFRYYINVSHELTDKLQLWVKWAQTSFHDRRSIGSGLDEISGNRRSEIRLQARFSF
jgi:hypothetical protein